MAERAWSDRLAGWIAWNHEEVERSVRAVAPALVNVRPSTKAPSVGFHAWHIGRWIDRQAAALPGWLGSGATPKELWIEGRFAERWGLAGIDLGDYGGTGAGLDDEASAALALPAVDEILEYLTGAFRSLELAMTTIDDDAILARRVVDLYGGEETIGDVLLNHMSHADRHLGMIEALRGVLGEKGTATE